MSCHTNDNILVSSPNSRIWHPFLGVMLCQTLVICLLHFATFHLSLRMNSLNDLELIDWDSLGPTLYYDANKSFLFFHHKTKLVINKHAPVKSNSKRRAKQFIKPWITAGIMNKVCKSKK